MSKETIQLEQQYCANNYHPLPVVLTQGKGIYVWDDNGKQYIDMMSAYSAVSLGHCHPKITEVLCQQATKLGVISRAFYADNLGKFLEKLCLMTNQDVALPMNTGAEAVETAMKAARKWAYQVKGVAQDKAEIIACHGNFHGRTIAVVGMSSEAQYRDGFGPFPAGLRLVEYGDLDALEASINENTAALILEPIQGEAGIIKPPVGYLKACEKLCKKHNVLLICDEVQTGLGRTGKLLACQHESVQPDGLILGKALGGGVLPVSAFLSSKVVMDVFTPGDHGSTFGGYPLAGAVGLAVLNVLEAEQLSENSAKLGDYFLTCLQEKNYRCVRELRGQGLFIGIEIDPEIVTARHICEALMARGLLSKETHETVVRLAPPLVISRQQIDDALSILHSVLLQYD